MNLEIPDITGKELFDWLVANKSTLIAQKKFEVKRGDAFGCAAMIENDKGYTVKANQPVSDNKNEIDVTSVINTTYWYDSHGDVHIDGLWKRSLSQPKQLYLLQEHSMTFKGIISDSVNAYTKRISWRKLGVEKDGYTEALVFESKIAKTRNEYMFNEYKNGNVKNHSVGMRYVGIDMAINSDQKDYSTYKEVWDKHIDKIANKEDAEERGYFWAVTEAKVIEGSAVPIGSNVITPTQSVKNIEPPSGTQQGSQKCTLDMNKLNNLLNLTKSVK